MAGAKGQPISGNEFELVSATLARGGPLQETLDLIMQRACDLLEVHEAGLFLAEWPGPYLRLAATSAGLPTQPIVLAPNQGVEGWVARRARPLAVADPSADPRFAGSHSWSSAVPPGTPATIAAVPVRTAAAVAGVLSVIYLPGAQADESASHPLGAESIADLLPFLAVLADLVALALENSAILRRQERRTQFIKLLHTIATIPAPEATEELAQTITNQLCAITLAEVASILLHSTATDELIALGISDTSLGQVQRESGRDHLPLATSGPLLRAFQSGAPALITSERELSELPMLEAARIQSLLLVPLRVEQESQGLIVLASPRADAFSDDDLSFITFISTRLSYALRHKTLAEEIAALEQERIQQDARESFIAIVAHDLKNALMAISGSGHLALRKAARGDTQYSQQALPVVVAKAAQAIQLVNDMVDVNNVDRGRFRMFIAPIELVALVREEVEAAQGLSAQHTIELHSAFDEIEIAADGQRLRQVLSNLISNAIRFSPDGGVVRVQLTSATDQAPRSGATPPPELPQALMLTIIDQGIGISPEDLPHIFDRFYRGRGGLVASGSGLGLYITSEIIAQHGGQVWAESRLGAGTSFHVTLPMSRYA